MSLRPPDIYDCAGQGHWGCRENLCWAKCTGLGSLLPFSYEWCQTTKTHSLSLIFVSCSSDADCHPCWKCAGLCTIFGSSFNNFTLIT